MRKRIATLLSLPLLLNPMIGTSGEVMQTPLARTLEGDCVEKIGLRNEIHRQVEEYQKVQWQNANTIEYDMWLDEQERLRIEEEERKAKFVPVTFEVSFYCPCSLCSDEWGTMTASGKSVSRGIIALPSNIPFGTKAHIEGLGTFTNEDRGGYITYTSEGHMRVDVFVWSHEEALSYGRFIANGYLEYE